MNNKATKTKRTKTEQTIAQLKETLETVYYSNQEINNSLAIILAAAEWLIENPKSVKKDRDRYLKIIINAVDRIKVTIEYSERIIEPLITKQEEPPSELLVEKLPKPINVLVVDDQHQFRFLLDKALEKVGYSVVLAEDGEEALELFKNKKFDLVITDVHMPKIDGIQLVKGIKEENPWVPIILISGFETEATIKEKLKREDIYFLRKPFLVRDLEKAIEKVLRKKAV